jgi:hypothetical protein
MFIDARTLHIIYEARKCELELKLKNARAKNDQSDESWLSTMSRKQGPGKVSGNCQRLLPAS